MPPLTYISAFRRTDATGGSRGEAMPERENVKNVNIVKREQIMAEFLGHSKDLITLSLSLSLSCANRQSHIIKIRGRPRVNIRLFMEKSMGGLFVFIPDL